MTNMKLSQALFLLFSECRKYGYSVTVSWENGKYVPGEFLDLNNPTAEVDPKNVRQGEEGFTVEVGNLEPEHNMFPTLDGAIGAGFNMLRVILEERSKKGKP